jgi:hypothetical protein
MVSTWEIFQFVPSFGAIMRSVAFSHQLFCAAQLIGALHGRSLIGYCRIIFVGGCLRIRIPAPWNGLYSVLDGGMSEWHLGDIASCQAMMAEAISLAKELNDTNALVYALGFAAVLAVNERKSC